MPVVSPDPPVVDPEEEPARLLADPDTGREGSGEREAARRLQQVGPNTIQHDEGPAAWRSLLGQFTHPLALLLWLVYRLPELGLLALFAPIVWGSDELRRAWHRCHLTEGATA